MTQTMSNVQIDGDVMVKECADHTVKPKCGMHKQTTKAAVTIVNTEC